MMKTFIDLGFNIEGHAMSSLFSVIKKAKTIKVESLADTLTDRSEPASFTLEEIDWMKTTAVSQITMGDTYTADACEFFDLLVNGEAKLRVSARSNNNGEFRGAIVKTLIEQAQTRGEGTSTVYDTFQSHISNVLNNQEFIYAINFPISTFLATFDFDPTSKIFKILSNQLRKALNAFALSIFNSLDELNNTCSEEGDVLPQTYAVLKEKLRQALTDVPISEILSQCCENPALLATCTAFEDQLHVIDEKLSHFTDSSEPFIAANALKKSLHDAINEFFQGTITTKDFKTNCNEACNTAQNSVLKDLHGWKEVIANIVFIVTSIVTFGLANLINKHVLKGEYHFLHAGRDRMDKIQRIKEIMERIPSTDIPSTEDHEENTSPSLYKRS